MIKISDHKATLATLAISLAAFFVFLGVIKYFEYLEESVLVKEEHRVMQAIFAEDKILVYEESITVPTLPDGNGVSLAMAFNETFATEECLLLANSETIKLQNSLLALGNITVFDKEWYNEVSQVDQFQQTLFAEGYFGVMRVSRPCYNEERNKAIVYVEQDCGAGCGNGEVVFLALEDGAWQRLGKRIVWVATQTEPDEKI